MINNLNDVLDPEFLAEPLSSDQPCGPEPRSFAAFRDIRDLQSEARRLEKDADDDPENAKAKRMEARGLWQSVVETGLEFVETQCRDLTTAGFVVDGWVRVSGLRGLRNGLILIRELSSRWWDGLHPKGDEEELEALSPEDRDVEVKRIRSEPVDGLNNRIPAALKRVETTDTRAVEDQLMVWQAKDARLDDLARQTGGKFYQNALADVLACEEVWKEIETLYYEKCGSDGPGTSRLREALEDARLLFQRLAALVPADSEGGGGDAGAQNGGGQMAAGGPGMMIGGPVVPQMQYTREHAFQAIENIAGFFEKTEPQSLIPAQLRKVVKWGRLPPEEFLKALLDDDEVLRKIFKLVGIKPKEDD